MESTIGIKFPISNPIPTTDTEPNPNKQGRFLRIAPDTTPLPKEGQEDRLSAILRDLVNELTYRNRNMASEIAEEVVRILASKADVLRAILGGPVEVPVPVLEITDPDPAPPSPSEPEPEFILEPEPALESILEPEPILKSAGESAPKPVKKKWKPPSEAVRNSLQYKRSKAFNQTNYNRKKVGLPPLPKPATWDDVSAPPEEAVGPDSSEDG